VFHLPYYLKLKIISVSFRTTIAVQASQMCSVYSVLIFHRQTNAVYKIKRSGGQLCGRDCNEYTVTCVTRVLEKKTADNFWK